MTDSYKNSGVDIRADETWVNFLQNLPIPEGERARLSALQDKIVTRLGEYASVYALSDQNWVATATDGIGTKLIWALKGLGSMQNLAQDLVAMNVNDLLCVGARPTLFLDYLAIASPDMMKEGGVMRDFLSGLQLACVRSGSLLVGGETAQMPDLYKEGDFDAAGMSVGFLAPDDYMSVENIQPGSQVWAWRSSGPHSNGYTWLRKLFDQDADAAFITEHLMPPTKLYVSDFLSLRSQLPEQKVWQGAYHITGSGLLNLLRIQPKNRKIGFDLHNWDEAIGTPTWAEAVQKKSRASKEELFRTYNMGVGFVGIFDNSFSDQNKKLLQNAGMESLGTVIDEAVVKVSGLELS